jgi:hypothetical protein
MRYSTGRQVSFRGCVDTVFFAAVDLGHPADGFRNALLVQFALLAAFLLLSPFFPPPGPPGTPR